MRRALGLLAATALLATALPMATASAGSDPAQRASLCDRTAALRVPGAEHSRAACLDDLTTHGLLGGVYAEKNPLNGVYSDYNDLTNLHAGTVNRTGVPGVQVDGYFPDTSTTNTLHGWNHGRSTARAAG